MNSSSSEANASLRELIISSWLNCSSKLSFSESSKSSMNSSSSEANASSRKSVTSWLNCPLSILSASSSSSIPSISSISSSSSSAPVSSSKVSSSAFSFIASPKAWVNASFSLGANTWSRDSVISSSLNCPSSGTSMVLSDSWPITPAPPSVSVAKFSILPEAASSLTTQASSAPAFSVPKEPLVNPVTKTSPDSLAATSAP